MGVVWPLASDPASGPLWCFNEYFRLSKLHRLIIGTKIGNERGVVRYRIFFCPPFLAHHLKHVGVPLT